MTNHTSRLLSGMSACALLCATTAISATAQTPFPGTSPADLVTVQIEDNSTLDRSVFQRRVQSFAEQDVSVSGPADIARALSGGATGGIELALVRETNGADGLNHMRLHQTFEGIRIYGTELKASLRDGKLDFVAGQTVRPGALRTGTTLTEADAIAVAVAAHHGGRALADDYWFEAPRAERVLIARGIVLEDAWEVMTWSEADNQLHHTLVGARGNVVESVLRTSQDRYRVYTNSPSRGSQVIRSGPGTSGNAQSPDGWLSTTATQYNVLIQGNNAAAYLDTDNNNGPDGAGARVISNGDFLAVHDPSSSPSTQTNKDVAVQNLFWLNNIIHDELYDHGFTEGAGNFQNNNFGRGGAGGDSVYAEAQDGGGVNNANFATPGDGSHPRMQMYIWNRTNPNRDGDLDSDIVWHEYGHGLTWRMIGNMSGAVSGALGEGMSDVLALLKNGDDAVGEYALNNSAGIRSERYGNYSRTLGDFTGQSVHFDGEIYAAAMWRAGENYRNAGLSNDRLMDRAVAGMNFTPSQPDYLEMRNGVLQAAPSSEDCLLWDAFAEYGMGQGATFTVSGGSVSIGESFDVPSACDSSGTTPTTVSSLTPRSTRTGSTWRGQVIVRLAGGNVSGQQVEGRWTNGLITRCTTDTSGQCTMTRNRINRRWSSVGFTIQTVAGNTAQGNTLTVRVRRP